MGTKAWTTSGIADEDDTLMCLRRLKEEQDARVSGVVLKMQLCERMHPQLRLSTQQNQQEQLVERNK